MEKLKAFFSYQRSILAVKIWAGTIGIFIFLILLIRFSTEESESFLLTLFGVDIAIGVLAFFFFCFALFLKDRNFRILTLLVLFCIATPIGYAFYEGNKESQKNQQTKQETSSTPVQINQPVQPDKPKPITQETQKPVVKKPTPTPPSVTTKEKPKEKKENSDDSHDYSLEYEIEKDARRLEQENERHKEGQKRERDYKANHPDQYCIFDMDGIPSGCVSTKIDIPKPKPLHL